MLTNSGINKVFLVGHIGKEPRWHSENGMQILCFPMVTHEYIKKNGETVEHAEWHQVKIPANCADSITTLKKGQLVYIQGKVQTRKLVDEQQVKRYKTEIIAHQVQLLTGLPVADAELTGL